MNQSPKDSGSPQAGGELIMQQYRDPERRPIRLILTVLPDQTSNLRVTWWTAGEGEQRLEWNFDATLDTMDASIQELQDEIRAEVLVQWKLQVEGSTDLLPWPEDIVTVVECHSTVSFFNEDPELRGLIL